MGTLWTTLGIVAAVLLFIFWGRRSAPWGGLTFGIVIGLAITVVRLIGGKSFSVSIILRSAIACVVVGGLAELLSWSGSQIKRLRR